MVSKDITEPTVKSKQSSGKGKVINQDPASLKVNVFIRRESIWLKSLKGFKHSISPRYYTMHQRKQGQIRAKSHLRIRRYPQCSHIEQVPCTTWAQHPKATEKKITRQHYEENISQWMSGGTIRTEMKR